jgi:hypothetical protein
MLVSLCLRVCGREAARYFNENNSRVGSSLLRPANPQPDVLIPGIPARQAALHGVYSFTVQGRTL